MKINEINLSRKINSVISEKYYPESFLNEYEVYVFDLLRVQINQIWRCRFHTQFE